MSSGMAIIVLATVGLLVLALAVDRRARRRHLPGQRAMTDRPAGEQRPPGDGFHQNHQSWS